MLPTLALPLPGARPPPGKGPCAAHGCGRQRPQSMRCRFLGCEGQSVWSSKRTSGALMVPSSYLSDLLLLFVVRVKLGPFLLGAGRGSRLLAPPLGVPALLC